MNEEVLYVVALRDMEALYILGIAKNVKEVRKICVEDSHRVETKVLYNFDGSENDYMKTHLGVGYEVYEVVSGKYKGDWYTAESFLGDDNE